MTVVDMTGEELGGCCQVTVTISASVWAAIAEGHKGAHGIVCKAHNS